MFLSAAGSLWRSTKSSGGAREVMRAVTVGGIGVPESINMSGTLPVLSLHARGTPDDPRGLADEDVSFFFQMRKSFINQLAPV